MHMELRDAAPAGPRRALRARNDGTTPSDLTSTSCVPRLAGSHFISARARSEPRRQRSMSPAREMTITAEEFEALPASIQKKYFSPLERLRINQQHLVDERKKQMHKRSFLTVPSTPEVNNRPATSPGLRRKSDTTDSSSQSFPLITAKQKHVSDEEARWFLTLPEKVRRQHFSREEQITLMIRCKRALESTSPDLASDAYQRCCPDTKRRSRMFSASTPRPSTSAGVSFDSNHSFLDIDAESVRTTETSNAEMKIFKLYSRRTASDVTTYETTTAEVLPTPSPPETVIVTTPKPRKRPPFRRLSLTPLPLPPPTLAPPITSPPSLTPLSRRGSLRPSSITASLSARLSRPYMDVLSPAELPQSEPTSPVRPYHDVDIRKQLRRTLLSAEKFDEALEFGFASDDTPTPASPHGYFNFPFKDVTGPTSDDEDSDPMPPYIGSDGEADDEHEDGNDTTSIDTASPRTPTPTTVDLMPSSSGKTPSVDSGIGLSYPLYQPTYVRPVTSLAESVGSPREWTLHMTLTRPDLAHPSPPSSSFSGVAADAQFMGKQSAEEALYSVQRQQTSGVGVETRDPLALARLDVCEDNTGAQGAFAVGRDEKRSNGLKKVWRRFTGVTSV